MRRRLDIPPLPFLQPDGNMYQLSADGTLIPFVEELGSDGIEDEIEEWGDDDGMETEDDEVSEWTDVEK